jgi:hypothetical protein
MSRGCYHVTITIHLAWLHNLLGKADAAVGARVNGYDVICKDANCDMQQKQTECAMCNRW